VRHLGRYCDRRFPGGRRWRCRIGDKPSRAVTRLPVPLILSCGNVVDSHTGSVCALGRRSRGTPLSREGTALGHGFSQPDRRTAPGNRRGMGPGVRVPHWWRGAERSGRHSAAQHAEAQQTGSTPYCSQLRAASAVALCPSPPDAHALHHFLAGAPSLSTRQACLELQGWCRPGWARRMTFEGVPMEFAVDRFLDCWRERERGRACLRITVAARIRLMCRWSKLFSAVGPHGAQGMCGPP
jgi:hypothetical protein